VLSFPSTNGSTCTAIEIGIAWIVKCGAGFHGGCGPVTGIVSTSTGTEMATTEKTGMRIRLIPLLTRHTTGLTNGITLISSTQN
jgi:hypothetical protein